MPEISVVIPVRNEGDRLARAIASIVNGRSRRFPMEIVLVDDASTDRCCQRAGDLFSTAADGVNIRILRLERWSGIPYARNHGGFAARSERLVITDANVLFSPGWDVPIWRELRADRALCATIADQNSSFRAYGCGLEFPSMGVRWLRHDRARGQIVPISPCTGTVIATSLFRQLGGYDTAMPIYGAAEPEFSVRLWLSGAQIVSVPDLFIAHRFRPRSERQPFLRQIGPVQIQNYLRFALLYLSETHFAQVLRYYSLLFPDTARRAARAIFQSEVWNRRAVLGQTLAHSFDYFARRFRLTDAAGRLLCGAERA